MFAKIIKGVSVPRRNFSSFDFNRSVKSADDVIDYLRHPDFLLRPKVKFSLLNVKDKVEIDNGIYQRSKMMFKHVAQSLQVLNLDKIKLFFSSGMYQIIEPELLFLKRNEIKIRNGDLGQTMARSISKKYCIYHGLDPYDLQRIPSSDIHKTNLEFSDGTVDVFINNGPSQNNITVAHLRVDIQHVIQNPFSVYWRNRLLEIPDDGVTYNSEFTYIHLVGMLSGDKFYNSLSLAEKFERASEYFTFCFEQNTSLITIDSINGKREKHIQENGLLY
jgi:hypothetical protein